MSKRISVIVEDELHSKIEKKVKQLGISKSAFVSFATSFLLHQLEQTEARTKQYSISAYQLLKHNLEVQQQQLKPSKPVKKKAKRK
ncbi:MAG: hypothetical protein H0Z32_15780 [Bacillaceae bacterium]|nr:hypothetical protein [Bacillaceae bacterium]